VSEHLVVLGPTASGKSDVAMAFASAHTGSEILAVDAMQVYRRMDVGTAKPSEADRTAIPHHGINLAEPSSEYTVAEFARAASASVADIAARGGRPVLVAGTGLYLRSITDPMEMPGRWPEVREGLEIRVLAEGPEVLYRELAALDPVAASRMEPTNERRIVRALEVTIGGGRPCGRVRRGSGQCRARRRGLRRRRAGYERDA
jgi:tRNA dimethylallyltransferase